MKVGVYSEKSKIGPFAYVASGKVTTLKHEARNDSVEG